MVHRRVEELVLLMLRSVALISMVPGVLCCLVLPDRGYSLCSCAQEPVVRYM